ncbi:MAG: hypothetical protein Q4G13_07710 [Moraxella sp.]|nr:hypothetical protein [Moraxella sp.]
MIGRDFKTIAILSFCALTLTACSVKTKLYSPPANNQTATLNYDISQDSFFSPHEYIKRDGLIERIDIQFKASRLAKPKTVFMALDRNFTTNTVFMALDRHFAINEANKFEVNKPLVFMYEHKVVRGFGEWPMLCVVDLRNVVLKANHSYTLQGYTTQTGEITNILNRNAPVLKCQMKIINNTTNEVIADTGLNNQLYKIF